MIMEQKEFEGLSYIISSLVCLSDQSQMPLPQLDEAIGRDNLEVIAEQVFLGSFMSYEDMSYEINRYCGLELSLDTPPREQDGLKWMGISLAGMVGSEMDLFTVLSVLATELAKLASPTKPTLPMEIKLVDETVNTVESNQVPPLHVVVDYFPSHVQEGLLRFQALEIFDIRADADTIEDGKEQLAAALMEYAKEYYTMGYDQDFRRRHHRPYITWILRADGLKKLQNMIVLKNEQAVRDAMASPEKNMQRLSSGIEDELVHTLLWLGREAGIQWGKASEEERNALEEQAMFEIESRYRESGGEPDEE